MSSNIKIQKNCEFCGDEFTARTLYTRYRSKSCNKKHYKQLLLEKNLNTKETQESIKISPVEIERPWSAIEMTGLISYDSSWLASSRSMSGRNCMNA